MIRKDGMEKAIKKDGMEKHDRKVGMEKMDTLLKDHTIPRQREMERVLIPCRRDSPDLSIHSMANLVYVS